ncbi:hypothetical protein PDIG_37640 [Penicillium digitatum PHI26]|uniref:Uncharacterized protein n=2 Tax=Penicillium digitatum TaxID=36651 RepID=K9FVC3_PEND2|nr:hypothetical protein PDIP_84230 [Penicillium digitatum Pd1]EKV05249.1 hypothetical protein PDIP_84230 [Penicillium digitatum Pd1]EKV13575.1 hypothetical protein PDIG_37640 [Penicillium digitatum PHI26]
MTVPARASRIRKEPPNVHAIQVTNNTPGNPALL